MKKRLRKKLRLQEFQEMGFAVKLELSMPDTDESYDAFWRRLVDMIEANHLLMGGILTDFFVCTDSRRTATEADRAAVEAWLRQQPEVAAVKSGPLVDAWYGAGRRLT